MNTEITSREDALAALRALCARGAVVLRVDRRQISSIDNPLVFEADSNRFLYLAAALAALVWWRVGITAGLITAAVLVGLFATVGQRVIMRRLERRIRDTGLQDIAVWTKLWAIPGLTLSGPDLLRCASPNGNWLKFVRDTMASPALAPRTPGT